MRIIAALFLAISLGSCSLLVPNVQQDVAQLRAGQYQLDKQHATLIFKVMHMGLSTFVGRFDDIDATLDFDPTDMSKTRLDARVMPTSIDVNNEGLEDSLRGSSWFDVQAYPQATFTTLSVQPQSANHFAFTGNLTLHGVTAPVTLDVAFNGGATNMLTGRYTIGFSATGTIKRSVFGIDEYIPLVGDDVALEVFAEFQRR